MLDCIYVKLIDSFFITTKIEWNIEISMPFKPYTDLLKCNRDLIDETSETIETFWLNNMKYCIYSKHYFEDRSYLFQINSSLNIKIKI